jgi:MFS family permease
MKRTVLLLAASQAILMTGGVILISTAGLVSAGLAADPALVTLPVALYFVALMATTVPASLLMGRVGRRMGFALGATIGFAGAGIAAAAIGAGSFSAFCAGAALLGIFNGFGNYYRFAAADAATNEYRSRAISYVMGGGIVAAFAGPTLASWTRGATPGAEFMATYAVFAGLCAAAILLSMPMLLPPARREASADSGRPLRAIARQPVFIVALVSAAVGYGVMLLLMTAAPLALHEHAFTFAATAFVIQWHVLGMFAPSFVTGRLAERFGVLNVLLAGCGLGAVTIVASLAGPSLAAFWVGLVALGVSWNFLFVGGTTLLTEAYSPSEKAKTQALNDLVVYTVVAAASLSAGGLQQALGWRNVNLLAVPALLLTFGAVWLLKVRRRVPAVAEAGAGQV